MKDYNTQKLKNAITIMRDACNDAERYIGEKGYTDLYRAKNILHIFIWMWANAQMEIEAVLSNIDREQSKPDP